MRGIGTPHNNVPIRAQSYHLLLHDQSLSSFRTGTLLDPTEAHVRQIIAALLCRVVPLVLCTPRTHSQLMSCGCCRRRAYGPPETVPTDCRSRSFMQPCVRLQGGVVCVVGGCEPFPAPNNLIIHVKSAGGHLVCPPPPRAPSLAVQLAASRKP